MEYGNKPKNLKDVMTKIVRVVSGAEDKQTLLSAKVSCSEWEERRKAMVLEMSRREQEQIKRDSTLVAMLGHRFGRPV